MHSLLRSFTSVGFVGRLPGAPGTYGSLVTLPLAFTWSTFVTSDPLITLGLIVVIAILGTFAATLVAKNLGVEDPSEIVIDELVGQWLAVVAIPSHWGFWVAAFILFRLFDIWKPWLIDRSQKLPGGLGIMMDDILAGILVFFIIQGTAVFL